jgi:DNA-binding MarR family transcriptional regulator
VVQSLAADLLTVVAEVNRLAAHRIRAPISYAQTRLLALIDRLGTARMSHLAALDYCSLPATSTQVRFLEDAGLVSRAFDPDDARVVLIRITPRGAATLRRVRIDCGAVINPDLQRLDAADRQTLKGAVRVLRRLLEDEAAQTLTKYPNSDEHKE